MINVGSRDEISITDLARRIIDQTASPSEIRYVPYDEAYEASFEDMYRRVPDIAKVTGLIGWEPTLGLERIIDDVAAHQREAPARAIAVGTPAADA